MVTRSTVLRALADLQPTWASHVAVTAAWTTGALVVDSQFDFAQRALGLDNRGYGAF